MGEGDRRLRGQIYHAVFRLQSAFSAQPSLSMAPACVWECVQGEGDAAAASGSEPISLGKDPWHVTLSREARDSGSEGGDGRWRREEMVSPLWLLVAENSYALRGRRPV